MFSRARSTAFAVLLFSFAVAACDEPDSVLSPDSPTASHTSLTPVEPPSWESDYGATSPNLSACCTAVPSFTFDGKEANAIIVPDGIQMYQNDPWGGWVGSAFPSVQNWDFSQGQVLMNVIGDAPDRRIVITWLDVAWGPDPSHTATFQAQMFEGKNEIQFGYKFVPVGSNVDVTFSNFTSYPLFEPFGHAEPADLIGKNFCIITTGGGVSGASHYEGPCGSPVSSVIEASVDIKPGSASNLLNLKGRGMIPVAVLTTDDLDATTIDASTVQFGPAGAGEAHGRVHVEDVDGDGRDDAMLHFRARDTGVQCGDTSATLTGSTAGGEDFEGGDSITTKC